MTRSRLIGLHALTLLTTLAMVAIALVSTAPRSEAGLPIRWILVGLGGCTAFAASAFARSALRELERQHRALAVAERLLADQRLSRAAAPSPPPSPPPIVVTPAEQPRVLR